MKPRDRATFEAGELATVLSHYDLGIIESITDFPRGSRRSPKVGIVAEQGKFLLKRRSNNRTAPDRVQFAHVVQHHLVAAGFPTPRLIPTRNRSRSLLQIRDYVYELFEFVGGHQYRSSGDGGREARDAGVVLARFHQGVDTLELSVLGQGGLRGDFHDAPGIRTGLCSIGSTLSSHDSFSGDEADLAALVQRLLNSYDHAADAVNRLGFSDWPERIIHADWHPGNLLFRNEKVVAVVDYDALRISRRMIDVSNGALQFSIVATGDPATWPAHLDEGRFHTFLSGYESLIPLSEHDRLCIPALMIEALTAECVPPITETGTVGRWSGYRVLHMVERKGAWIAANTDRLLESAKA